MIDYTKILPNHIEKYIGEHDLFLEIYLNTDSKKSHKKSPLLFLHGAYTGSWMWSKFIPHFVQEGFNCYVMNLRSHYKSRIMDLTKISFEDYLADVKEVLAECKEPPILIGFSMGGILGQKIAEQATLAGLVLVDTTICKEVYDRFPYKSIEQANGIIEPAPTREEAFSIDESPDDISFQKKYLAMESSVARNAFISYEETGGICVDNKQVTCRCLVISAVSSEEDDIRGNTIATYFGGEYTGLWNTTHTGLLVGQRYKEVVNRILAWLNADYPTI
ncbi:MAG: alpha/beta hydrolase [Velocimicrobium sp.]